MRKHWLPFSVLRHCTRELNVGFMLYHVKSLEEYTMQMTDKKEQAFFPNHIL